MARLTVRVTPRASRDSVGGFDADGRLQVRVTAPPADGAANAAVVKLLAAILGVPGRDIILVSGAASRLKQFDVALPDAALQARIAAALPPLLRRGDQ